MPFTLQTFAERRSFCYHFTSIPNLEGIIESRKLQSALSLGLPGLHHFQRRSTKVHTEGDGRTVHFQTQRPLYEGHILWEPDWDLARFVHRLNSLVFFWPGNTDGPIGYGERHRDRNFSKIELVCLRVPTADLFSVNLENTPHFCCYNSGAPRSTNGKRSPRGASTFLPSDEFWKNAFDVKEVVFEGAVRLAKTTEILLEGAQEWISLLKWSHGNGNDNS